MATMDGKSASEQPPYYVLLSEQKATKKSQKGWREKKETFVQALPGSLWEISKTADSKKARKFIEGSKVSLLLANVEDSEQTLRCMSTDVALLSELEFQFLVAVPQCRHRYKVHQDKGWVNEARKLKVGSFVHVDIENPKSHAVERATGIVQYIGVLPDEKGVWFGVELDEKWSECGTCSGEFRKRQMFGSARRDSAVFVAVNKIRAVRRSHHTTDGMDRVPNGLPVEHSELSNGSSPDLTPPPLKIGERVVWLSDQGPEAGSVEWIGVLEEDGEKGWFAGVNFDNPVGSGTGRFHDQQLFKANPGHASMVPIIGLMKAIEYYQGPEPDRPAAVITVSSLPAASTNMTDPVNPDFSDTTLDTSAQRTVRRDRSPYYKRRSTDNLVAEENVLLSLGNQKTTRPKQKDMMDYYKHSYQTDRTRSQAYGNHLTVRNPSSGSDTTTPDRSPLSSPHSPQLKPQSSHTYTEETDPMYERLVDIKSSKVSTPSPTSNHSSPPPPAILKASQSDVIYAQVSRHSTPPLRSHHTDGALHHNPVYHHGAHGRYRERPSPEADLYRDRPALSSHPDLSRDHPSPDLTRDTVGRRRTDLQDLDNGYAMIRDFDHALPLQHQSSSGSSSVHLQSPTEDKTVHHGREAGSSLFYVSLKGKDATFQQRYPTTADEPCRVPGYAQPMGRDLPRAGVHTRAMSDTLSNPRASPSSTHRIVTNKTIDYPRPGDSSYPGSALSSPSSQTSSQSEPVKRTPITTTTIDPADIDSPFSINSMVEIPSLPVERRYGVVRWMGRINDKPQIFVGLEMEEEHQSYTDGAFCGVQLFTCSKSKAFFCQLSKIEPDKRFVETMSPHRSTSNNFGSMECPDVYEAYAPLTVTADLQQLDVILGQNKGIQGHHNSCYLDATLFSMFAFTTVFDMLLWRQKQPNDISKYDDVQDVLQKCIVNPLRKNFYVRADKVLKLRTLLDKLGSVQGMMTEEKDPEEFITSLLEQILKADPFITLSSGQHSFMYQLIVEKDDRITLPTIQQLLELSFYQEDIKLREEPRLLMLQMPRFGKDYKMYSKIMPSLYLDVTDVLEYGPRECYVCGTMATYECRECFKLHLSSDSGGLRDTCFCDDHCQSYHMKRPSHKPRPLERNKEFEKYLQQRNQQGALVRTTPLPRVKLELFAVICIHTSHYVSFVKCGSGPHAPWIFFDSMADRQGQENGYNIPEVSLCNFLPELLLNSDKYSQLIEKDPKSLPEQMRRLVCDGYICMYQNTELLLY